MPSNFCSPCVTRLIARRLPVPSSVRGTESDARRRFCRVDAAERVDRCRRTCGPIPQIVWNNAVMKFASQHLPEMSMWNHNRSMGSSVISFGVMPNQLLRFILVTRISKEPTWHCGELEPYGQWKIPDSQRIFDILFWHSKWFKKVEKIFSNFFHSKISNNNTVELNCIFTEEQEKGQGISCLKYGGRYQKGSIPTGRLESFWGWVWTQRPFRTYTVCHLYQ